jgi:hypothetical protein
VLPGVPAIMGHPSPSPIKGGSVPSGPPKGLKESRRVVTASPAPRSAPTPRSAPAPRSLFSTLQTALSGLLIVQASPQITSPTEPFSSIAALSPQLSQPPLSSLEAAPRGTPPLLNITNSAERSHTDARAGSSLSDYEMAREENDGNLGNAKDQDE